MKTKHKIIAWALAMGFLTWVFDASMDYLFFYKAPFMDSLITKVSGHETYMRLVIVFSLLIFGIVISGFYTRLDEQGEQLKGALTGAHRHQAETAALLEASRAVMEHQTFAAAARAIFDHSREIIGAPGGYISLTDKTGTQNEVVFLEAGGLPCTVDPDDPMPIRGLRADAYEEGRAIYDNNFAQSPYKAFLPEGHVRMDNVLFAPLLLKGKPVGLLGLANKPGGFTDHDAVLAAGFAELAAIALVNKRAEEDRERLIHKVEAERSFLKMVVEQMPAGVAIAEAPSGKLMLGNKALKQIWRFAEMPVDVQEGLSQVQVFHADGNPYRLEQWPLMRSLKNGEKVLGEEAEIIRQDGSRVALKVSSAPIKDSQGDILAAVSTCIDITERKAAEEVLRLREEHLRYTFDQSPIGAAIVSLDYRYVQVNAEFCRLVGYSEKELQALTFRDITYPEDLAADLGEFNRLVAGEIDHFRLDKRYIRKDGQVVWARLSVGLIKEASGAPLHFLAMVEDITARKQAEEALRQSQELFRQIGENIRDMIFVRDIEATRLLYANPAYETIWGRTVESLHQNLFSFLEGVHPEDRERVAREAEQHSRGEVFDHEYRIVRPDGDIRWVQARIFPIRNGNGVIYRIGGVVEDVTERKGAEREIRRLASFPLLNPSPVLEVDEEGRVLHANPAARQVAEKLSLSEGVGAFLPSDLKERFAAVRRGGDRQYAFDLVLSDAIYAVFVSFPHDLDTARLYAMDITERKRAEEDLKRAHDELEQRVKERTAELRQTVEQLQTEIAERETAEGKLRESEARFRTLLQTAGICIFTLTPNGRIIEFNREAERLTGWKRHEVAGQDVFSLFIAKANRVRAEAELAKIVSGEITRSFEFPFRLKDGTERIFLWNADVISDYDGQPMEVIAVGQDITERKQAAEALAAERQRLFSLFNQLPAFVYLIAPDYSIPFANSRFRELFGEHEGQNCHSLIRGLDGPCPECPATTTFQTGKPTEYELNLPDGRVYQMYAYPFGDVDGSPLVLKMGIDITARKQAEEAIKEQSRILEAFFEHTITPLVFLDKDFTFIRVNDAYSRSCHREVSEFPGRNHFELYPHEENEAIFAEVVQTKTPYQAVAKAFEFPDHPEWGVTYWDWTLVPVLDDHGAVDFLVFSLNDVTQRVLAEEKKVQLHEILEATPDMVGTADTYGRVFYMNQAGRQMVGLGVDESLARATIADFHPPEASELIYTQAIPTSRREGVWQGETKLRSRDGREIPISQVILAHRAPEGAVRFYSTIARDISDMKKAEASLRMLTSQLLKAQEVERRRLSRELHDELGQSLLVLKLQTKSIERKLPQGQDVLREDCSRALKYIDEIINNVRRLSRDLSPSILEDLGLFAALNYLLDEFRRHHETLNFLVELEPIDQYISTESQMNIFRIFQESLTNIAKYAQASRVKVVFKKEGDMLLGVVEDDGEGFEVSEIMAKDGYDKGLGLAAMEERVRIMGGSLDISSEKGGGTKVAFHVPLNKDA